MSPLPNDNITESGVEKVSDLKAAGEGVGDLRPPPLVSHPPGASRPFLLVTDHIYKWKELSWA